MRKNVGLTVRDYENSYAFAMNLLNQYIEHTTELSAHIGGYDSWEEYIATKKGETYYYGKALTFPQIPQYFLTTGNMRRIFP